MIPHSNRYPKHNDPEKGQTYNGVCNITLCDNEGAICWNGVTYGFYCLGCAADINRYAPSGDICFALEQEPTPEEMRELNDRACGRKKEEDREIHVDPEVFYIMGTGDRDFYDEPEKLSKKALRRANEPRPEPAVVHTMTRQLRRKMERDALKGRA